MNISLAEQIALMFAEVRHERSDLHHYQAGPDGAIEFLRENKFSMLMIDMGLGKTVSALTLIGDLLLEFSNEAEKTLVIAPLRVATDTWPTEIATWRHTAWMDHELISGDLEERERAALSSKSLHIVNREQVEWLVEFHGASWPYRTVIIDESSSFKDHTSKRFKALAKVRNTPGLIDRLHLLTATPCAESYMGLFAQIFLLDRGARLGLNITSYREEYFIYNQYSMKYKLRKGADEEILSKLKDLCLVMKRDDYLPRDRPTIIEHLVHLDPLELRRIKKLEKDFVCDLPDGTEIEAKTAAILASMLLQMASGSVYETVLMGDWETEDLKKVKKVHNLHDKKIESLKEIVEEARLQGENLMISYYFQSSLAKLKKAFPKAVVMDRDGKCVKDWNAGKIPLLLIHPQSAGHGLNLQKGGRTLIIYDLFYSLELYLQLIGRIDRQGQERAVVVRVLIAEGTRDKDVFGCLRIKEDAQEKMFAILKRLIREYRKAKKARELAAMEEEL